MSEPQAKVVPACPKPCSACPWRLANQGTPHPHGFYTKKNLVRLWSKLRDGDSMTCHPTDPRMVEFEGYENTAERDETHECAGAITLVQREFMLFQGIVRRLPKGSKDGLKHYRKLRPRGLTRSGIAVVFSRAAFGGSILGGLEMTQLDLNDHEIGHAVLPWTDNERELAFGKGE